MIATQKEIYSLRRILVRRLQATSRGVSRRERVEQQHQFAEEWSRFIAGKSIQGGGAMEMLKGQAPGGSLLLRLVGGGVEENARVLTGAELQSLTVEPLEQVDLFLRGAA